MFGSGIRVSDRGGREGPSFISPQVQRETIESLRVAHGLELSPDAAHHVQEMDVSGGKAIDNRPIGEVVRAVEAGELEGIIFWELKRFSRSLVDGVTVAMRVMEAGGRILASDFDSNSPMAKAMLGFLFGLAEEDLDQKRGRWADVRGRAVTRGAAPFKTPYGYRRVKDGLLVPNPETAPVVRRIFHLRAEGFGIAEIARRLEGVPSPTGEPSWSHSTISQILRNRVYLGEQKHGEFAKENAHEAIVSESEFSAAQVAKTVREVEPRAHSAGALLPGIARCTGCGHTLKIVTGYGGKLRYYCKGPYASGPCPARCLARVDELDPFVEDWFLNAVKDNVRVASAVRANQRAVDAQRALDEAEAQLGGFVETADALEPADFRRGYEARRGKAELLKLELANATQEVRQYGDLPDGDMLKAWPALAMKRKRQLVAAFVDRVNVSKGSGPVAGRVQFVRDGVVIAPEKVGEVLAENR